MKRIKRNSASYQDRTGVSTTSSAAQLSALGGRLFAAHPTVRVWLFSGPLGAGKSTMIRGMLRAAGHRGATQSPTYVLVHPYWVGGRAFVHIDAYRVRDRREWAALGIDEWLSDPWAMMFVEWPEKLHGQRWGAIMRVSIAVRPRGRLVRWRAVRPRAGTTRRGRRR